MVGRSFGIEGIPLSHRLLIKRQYIMDLANVGSRSMQMYDKDIVKI